MGSPYATPEAHVTLGLVMSLPKRFAHVAFPLTLGVLLVVSGCSAGGPSSTPAQETVVLTIDTDRLIDGTFVGSANRRRAAFSAKDGDSRYVVVDGQEGPRYSRIGTVQFSTDNLRVAYSAQRDDDRVVLVVDGTETPPYDAFAPSASIFSPNGLRVAYGAQTGDSWTVVVDGVEGRRHDGVDPPFFSPDSRRVA